MDASPSCNTCKKSQSDLTTPLKRCAKCLTARYCSQDCQKADWKSHKTTCSSKGTGGSISSFGPNIHASSSEIPANFPPPRPTGSQHNPGFEAINALLGMDNNDYLHKLPEKDMFEQLIDCFRLRCEDEHMFAGESKGIYNLGDPRKDFQDFLDLAESRQGLLPGWWDGEKRGECERIANGGGNGWANINHAVEKSDIQEHYGKPTMPMTLRVLGEQIYGKGFTPSS